MPIKNYEELMTKNKKISVEDKEITFILDNEKEYISLTDMLKAKDGDFFISDWLRNRNTWVEKTNGIGLKTTTGRYGGTYAHPDIPFKFGMWISPQFKIYLIKEFQCQKDEENDNLKLDRTCNGHG